MSGLCTEWTDEKVVLEFRRSASCLRIAMVEWQDKRRCVAIAYKGLRAREAPWTFILLQPHETRKIGELLIKIANEEGWK